MEQGAHYAPGEKDAQTWLVKEEFVPGMEQIANCAAAKDAQAWLPKGECAVDMGQRSKDAAVKDAQTML